MLCIVYNYFIKHSSRPGYTDVIAGTPVDLRWIMRQKYIGKYVNGNIIFMGACVPACVLVITIRPCLMRFRRMQLIA